MRQANAIPDLIAQELMQPFRHFGHTVAIAGGAAFNFDKTSDVDIWILTHLQDEVELREHAVCIASELQSSIDKTNSTWANLPFYPQRNMYRVIELYNWTALTPKKIQVMLFPATTVHTLLSQFDLSIHAHALYVHGGTLYHQSHGSATEYENRVRRWDTPYSTLRRLFALNDRYGFRANWADVERLCHEIEVLRLQREQKGIQSGKGMPLDDEVA